MTPHRKPGAAGSTAKEILARAAAEKERERIKHKRRARIVVSADGYKQLLEEAAKVQVAERERVYKEKLRDAFSKKVEQFAREGMDDRTATKMAKTTLDIALDVDVGVDVLCCGLTTPADGD